MDDVARYFEADIVEEMTIESILEMV